MRYKLVVTALFWTATWSVKSSFLAWYWWLFEHRPQYRQFWRGVMAFTALANVGCWIANVQPCYPPSTSFEFDKWGVTGPRTMYYEIPRQLTHLSRTMFECY